MNVDVGIWARLTRVVMALLVLAGVLGVVVSYLPVIRQNEAMRKEILRLDQLITAEQEKARRLEASIRALRTDPAAVERLAREKLGYARPGETIVLFEEPLQPAN